MEESNYYEDRKNREFLDNTPEKNKSKGESKHEKKEKEETEKEKLMRTAKEVGTDFAVGVLGGGLGAAVCGRYSLLTGLLVSGWGHYTKNKHIARLGLGLMASSSMTGAQGVKQDPNATMTENIQERVKAFGQELKRRLFLDKLGGVKKQDIAEPAELHGVETQTTPPTPEVFNYKENIESQNVKPGEFDYIKKFIDQNLAEIPQKPLYKIDDDDLTSIEEKLY